jgi:hypothetical protein
MDTLTMSDFVALERVVRAARSNLHIRYLPTGKELVTLPWGRLIEGEAQAIYADANARPLTGTQDIRDGFLRVALRDSLYDGFYPVRELMYAAETGCFAEGD